MYPATNRQIVVNVMKECYAMPQREFQYAAQEVASANFRLLCGKDDATQRQALLDIKWMLTHDKSYCDTVDWIASKRKNLHTTNFVFENSGANLCLAVQSAVLLRLSAQLDVC